MISQVARWGNSQGIRIERKLLLGLGLKLGDPIEVIKTNNEIILRPQHTAEWFLQDYERPNENESWEFYNEPKGREVW